MRYFLTNILILLAAIVLTIPILVIGVPYSIGHSMYMTFKKSKYQFFYYLIRFLKGILYAFGYLFFHIAKFLDILWCVLSGELFEDMLTKRENTLFGTFITLSEATGREEKDGFLTPFGIWFSKLLNKAFGQAQHCLDALELGIKRRELESKYYKK